MKKVLFVALAFGLFALPALAQVEAGAGKITVHANIDFLGKWVSEDKIDNPKMLKGHTVDINQQAVEDFILRDTVLSLGGELSDKVSWELTSQWSPTPVLLTGKINLKLIPLTTLTVGKFLPDQSPALQYHILSRVHTIYFPMFIEAPNFGASESATELSEVILSPGFQTGAQAKIGGDSFHVSLGWFNGLQPSYDAVTDTISTNRNNFSEADNSKAGLIKVAANVKGVMLGGHWWSEYANNAQKSRGSDDMQLDIYGFYAGYNHEKFHILYEYLENKIDYLDPGAEHKVRQNDWYVQAGVSPLKAIEIVARYEQLDSRDLARDDFINDEESWITVGANYFLLDKNAAIALQYIWKDNDDLNRNNNELDLLVEVDL